MKDRERERERRKGREVTEGNRRRIGMKKRKLRKD